jgi:tight adherence protein B
MLLIIMSICGAIFAIALLIMMTRSGGAKRVNKRLDALDQQFAPTSYEEKPTDIRKDQKQLSTIPWLNYWLTRMNLAATSSRFLDQAGVTVSLGTLVLTSIAGAAILTGILYFRFGAALPALLGLVFLPLPVLYIRYRRTKRLGKLEQQLPEALGTIVSALRVGHSLIASLGAVAHESSEPIAGEMRKCFDEQNYGIDLRTALVNLTDRVPVQDYRIFVAAVMIQKESGGNLAQVLEKVAETTRERFRLKKQVSVHTAQGRLTGYILSVLPLVLGFAMYLVNPEGMSVLWKRPIGLKMLYTATIMDLIGAFIIRKIVQIRV